MTQPDALSALDPLRAIALHSRHRATKPALVDQFGTTSYGELWDQVERIKQWLQSAGVGRGHRVATAMEPSTVYAAVVLAVLDCGATVAPVNTRLSAPEVAAFLGPLEPSVAIVEDSMAWMAGDDIPTIAGSARGRGSSLTTWVDGIVKSTPRPGRSACAGVTDTALILGTGGTTGLPKAACFSGAALALWCTHAASAQRLHSDDVELFASPFFHGTLITSLLSVLTIGATVVIVTRPSDPDHEDLLRDTSVTRVGGAPQLISRLAAGTLADARQRSGIRIVQYGTTSASEEFVSGLAALFPNAQAITGYGSTEFGPVTRLYGKECASPTRGVGRPIQHVEMAVLTKDGATIEPGAEGELLVRAPWQMHSYWNNQRATSAAFHDRYIRSGDLATFDADGYVHLRGRIKDIIISGGENVFPAEVEAVLGRHPSIDDVAVYGMDDSEWGERIEAAVVPTPGAAFSVEALRTFARGELAGYKIPKTIRVVDEIPLTANLKVDRHALRRSALQHAEGIDGS